ncbi:alpha/beta fold hydrolase [Luteimicrobium sp. NPDC057192]|uniref:alpha/beta fold hydrolase n=1 Tax=Luteimicrobium sp. NPDC057192 TaxID=3346042 RepID=UPI003625D788
MALDDSLLGSAAPALPDVPRVAPYGDREVPDGVEVVGLDVPAGRLTALVAAPAGQVRGAALLVPGFTGSKEDFLPVLRPLADAGWLVLAYSRRGQPDSVMPAGSDAYAVEREARDVLDVAGLLRERLAPGLPLHLLGHSYGGILTRAAVLVDPSPFASYTMFCSGPHGWALGPDGRAVSVDDVVGSVRESVGLARAAVHGPLVDLTPAQRFETRRLADAHLEGLEASAVTLQLVPDATDELAAVARAHALPVHVVHGDADDAWPIAWQREMAERLGARYTVVPGAGHSPQNDQPAATAQVWSEFWAGAAS